ncbi:hypothetical protein DPMN_187913 [Dreissena polymorpha]|uniref:Uncharacterized protein n=1 Tax=Dreissena polymorpha TaxID=45954 RepID=A0A9D4IAT8_DREPO|nr:hypothetical protein DPMN_187913 [Dreissena polymorpha]
MFALHYPVHWLQRRDLLYRPNIADWQVGIAISNTSILCLPFITQYTGFRGKIFCTDPTLQIGK